MCQLAVAFGLLRVLMLAMRLRDVKAEGLAGGQIEPKEHWNLEEHQKSRESQAEGDTGRHGN